jgi:hypothetical protein
MALPSSGQLSFSAIAGELGVSLSNVSLRSMSSTAGKSTPDAVSEFYGYSGGGLIAVSWGYNSRNIDRSCTAVFTTFYADNSSPNAATAVYTDAAGTIPGFIGFYSDGISAREFDGTNFIGFGILCF